MPKASASGIRSHFTWALMTLMTAVSARVVVVVVGGVLVAGMAVSVVVIGVHYAGDAVASVVWVAGVYPAVRAGCAMLAVPWAERMTRRAVSSRRS